MEFFHNGTLPRFSRYHSTRQSERGERRHFQIGPRIRVGGTLGKIGQDVKIAAGKALSNPIVDGALTFIPGVGPVLAGAAGAAGKALDTSGGGLHGVGGALDLAGGAASGYAAGKVGTALKAGFGAGGVTGAAKSLIPQSARSLVGGGDSGYDSNGEPITSQDGGGHMGIPGLPTSVSDMLDAGGSFLKDHLGQAVNLGTGVLSAAQAAKLAGESTQYGKDALNTTRQSYDARAPLRVAGIAGLLDPTKGIDLSGVKGAVGAGNPFNRPIAAHPYQVGA